MNEVPPTVAILQMAAGYQVSQALYAVAELDIASLLLQRPRTIDELARSTGANPDALRRLVRFLEPLGILRAADGTVEVTDLGAVLADGVPGSARAGVRYWMKTHYAPFSDFIQTMRTGEPAAPSYFGKPFFDWVAEDPALVEVQNAAFGSSGLEALREAALVDYVLPGEGTVADIGGAEGHLLARLLAAQPERHGIVFDLPEVVERARGRLSAAGLADRVEIVGGDFFQEVPIANVYLMAWILHDWSDADSTRILKTVARAAPRGARLVLLEMIVPEDASPHMTKSVDLNMMTLLGAKERSATEWRELLQAGGFAIDRIIENRDAFSIIEATLQ